MAYCDLMSFMFMSLKIDTIQVMTSSVFGHRDTSWPYWFLNWTLVLSILQVVLLDITRQSQIEPLL